MEENEIISQDEILEGGNTENAEKGFQGEADTLDDIVEDTVAVSDEESVAVLPETEEGSAIDEAEETADESIESLKAEVERLRNAIAEREKHASRMMEQIGEFSEVYPEKSLESIPSEVWNSVKGGVPLAAAYALYEKKTALHTALTREVNSKNAERSSGAVGKECDCLYYSPAEVREMSPAEVREKYNIIIESMKKWN